MSVYDIAGAAFEAGDLSKVKEVLEPLALQDDREAQTALGTLLSLTNDQAVFLEGVEWLRRAADSGYGHAAHNLATCFMMGGPGLEPNRERARSYIEQDHRRVKSRVAPMLGFKRFGNASIVIAGIELAQKLRKGQFNIRRLVKRAPGNVHDLWMAVLGHKPRFLGSCGQGPSPAVVAPHP